MSERETKPAEKSPGEDPDKDRVIHEYDGIQEYDNRLPNWWLYTLFGSIIFAGGYWLHYESFKVGPSPKVAYDKEMAAINAAEAEKVKAMGAVTEEGLRTLAKDAITVADGKATFEQVCFTCHLANGGGNIGPNLTDGSWLHGGSPEKIYLSIRDGWPEKGMLAWGPQLGEQKVRALAAFVLTIKGSNVAGGKAPQGTAE